MMNMDRRTFLKKLGTAATATALAAAPAVARALDAAASVAAHPDQPISPIILERNVGDGWRPLMALTKFQMGREPLEAPDPVPASDGKSPWTRYRGFGSLCGELTGLASRESSYEICDIFDKHSLTLAPTDFRLVMPDHILAFPALLTRMTLTAPERGLLDIAFDCPRTPKILSTEKAEDHVG